MRKRRVLLPLVLLGVELMFLDRQEKYPCLFASFYIDKEVRSNGRAPAREPGRLCAQAARGIDRAAMGFSLPLKGKEFSMFHDDRVFSPVVVFKDGHGEAGGEGASGGAGSEGGAGATSAYPATASSSTSGRKRRT